MVNTSLMHKEKMLLLESEHLNKLQLSDLNVGRNLKKFLKRNVNPNTLHLKNPYQKLGQNLKMFKKNLKSITKICKISNSQYKMASYGYFRQDRGKEQALQW